MCKEDDVEEVMGLLAAGPLENLLTFHGSLIVDEVINAARGNEKFKALLGGVWYDNIPEDVYQQIINIPIELWNE